MYGVHNLVHRFRQLYLAGQSAHHAQMQPAGSSAKYLKRFHPLTDAEITAHLRGTATYAAPLIGAAGLCFEAALDIDAGGEAAIREGLAIANSLGFTAYGIYSPGGDDGHDGGHIRIPLANAAAPTRARLLAEAIKKQLCSTLHLTSTTIETYPTRKALRLPFGVHTWTGKRGVLILQDGQRVDLDTGEPRTTIAHALTLIESLPPTNPDQLPLVQETSSQHAPQTSPNALHGQKTTQPIQDYNRRTNLLDWLSAINARVAYQTSAGGLMLHCPCPHHQHGDARPSLELQPTKPHKQARDGAYILIGHAPACTFHTEPHQVINAFDAYCRWESLSTKDAIKRLTSTSPAPHAREPEKPRHHKRAKRTDTEDDRHGQRVTEAAALHTHISERATADTGLSDRARQVLAALLLVASQKGMRSWCRPSIARIAQMTAQSRRTVYRGLADLEERGYISSKQPTGQTTTIRHFLRVTATPADTSAVSPMVNTSTVPTPTKILTCEQGPDSQQVSGELVAGPAGAVWFPGGAAYVPPAAAEWYADHVPTPRSDQAGEAHAEREHAPAEEPPPQTKRQIPLDPVKRNKYFKLLGAARKTKTEPQARHLRLLAAQLLEERPVSEEVQVTRPPATSSARIVRLPAEACTVVGQPLAHKLFRIVLDDTDPWVQLQRCLLERAEREGDRGKVLFYRSVLHQP